MSDEELVEQFQSFLESLKQKPVCRKGSELFAILKAHKKRELLRNVPDADLVDQYKCLKADYEQKRTFWKWKGLAYLKKKRWKEENCCSHISLWQYTTKPLIPDGMRGLF